MTLEEATGKWAEDLIVILNTDHALTDNTKGGGAPRSVVEFEAYYRTITKRNNANVFAIVKDGHAIGLGMLAHRDYIANSVRLSFWIGTKHMTEDAVHEAFKLLVKKAIDLELDFVVGAMSTSDEWLVHAWEKAGAERRGNSLDGHTNMILDLKNFKG